MLLAFEVLQQMIFSDVSKLRISGTTRFFRPELTLRYSALYNRVPKGLKTTLPTEEEEIQTSDPFLLRGENT